MMLKIYCLFFVFLCAYLSFCWSFSVFPSFCLFFLEGVMAFSPLTLPLPTPPHLVNDGLF